MPGEKKTDETGDSTPLVNKIIDTVVDAAASYVKGVAADGAETLEKKARNTRLGKAAVALADQAEKATPRRAVSKKANALAKSKKAGGSKSAKKAKKKTAKKASKKSPAKKSSAKKSSAKKSVKKAAKKTAKKKTAKKAKKSRR